MKFWTENKKVISARLTAQRMLVTAVLFIPALVHIAYKVLRRHAQPSELIQIFRPKTWKLATEPVLLKGRYLIKCQDRAEEENLPPLTFVVHGSGNNYVAHRKTDAVQMSLHYTGEVIDRKGAKKATATT